MLRNFGFAPAALLLILLFGCDPFSTRSLAFKPSDVRALQGPTHPGDSAVFRVRESLFDPKRGVDISLQADKRVTFVFLKDSAEGGDTLKAYTMRVTDFRGGALIEQGLRLLALRDGVELRLPGRGGAARFFPMKVSATAEDSGGFQALPPVFAGGLAWSGPLGIFAVTREISGVDTLDFGGHLEESWRVAEKVMDGTKLAAHGDYWYGASGLLKAVETWDDFDYRNNAGAAVLPGRPALRRVLERL
jgi:hypothetical protein